MKLNPLFISALTLAVSVTAFAKQIELLNVSYDPTRELYQAYNPVFAKYWKAKTGDIVTFKLSHGGSGKQARSVIDGLPADVVTLALAADVDALYDNARLIPQDWQKRLPDNSAPYTSTIVFLVRKGNPKGIRDWNDLIQPGVSVITPNPRTSGGARWNYLAAWGFASKKFNGNDGKIKEFVAALYKNVPVLDPGARAAGTTFTKRGIGDVLLAWENEAILSIKESLREHGQPDDFEHVVSEIQHPKLSDYEIIVPSLSILAEPTVSVVDKVAKKKGNAEVAKAFLEYLYSEEGQDIVGKNFYRPRSTTASAKYASVFPSLELITIDGAFGGWAKAQKTHFADGGTFDQIYAK
jgi:sulfate transport system substrate-binding protein